MSFIPGTLLANEPTKYEQDMLSERRSIVQLHLEIDTDFKHGTDGGFTRTKRTIWQDGDKRRSDEWREYKGEVKPGIDRSFRVVSVETPRYLITWDDEPDDPGGARVIAHFELNTPEQLKELSHYLAFDARLLGLSLSSIHSLRGTPFNLVIGSPDRIAPAVVTKDGNQVTVTFTRASP